MTADVKESSKLSQNFEVLNREGNYAEIHVSRILYEIGVPVHVKGYHYARAAILLALKSPDVLRSVTRVVYPTVAQMYNTTPSKVERAIRSAIELAWNYGDYDVLNHYFGYTIHNRRGRPTNCEFLSMITDHVWLDMKTAAAT